MTAPDDAGALRPSGFYWVSESDEEPVVRYWNPVVREWTGGAWQNAVPDEHVKVLGERLEPPGLSGGKMLSITALMGQLVRAVRELDVNWEAKGEGFLIRIMAKPPKRRKSAAARARSV